MDFVEPKSSVGFFKLPWGVIDKDGNLLQDVQMREWTGEEEDVLANRNKNVLERIDEILLNCIVKFGECTERRDIAKLFSNITNTDKMVMMVQNRTVTFGPIYQMEIECSYCEKKQNRSINLDELELKRPVDPMKRFFEERLPSGQSVTWEVLPAKLEKITFALVDQKSSDLLYEKSRVSFGLWQRMVNLNGFQFSRTFGFDSSGKPVLKKDEIDLIKKMSVRDRSYLKKRFEEVEGGYDMNFEFICENNSCKKENKGEVNIVQGEFFFPKSI